MKIALADIEKHNVLENVFAKFKGKRLTIHPPLIQCLFTLKLNMGIFKQT
jgi:hypothetical protein